MTSMYYDNWITVFPFIPQKDGSVAFYINAGTGPLAAHDVADVGASAAGGASISQMDKLRASAVSASHTPMCMGHTSSRAVVCSVTRIFEWTPSARSCPGRPRKV